MHYYCDVGVFDFWLVDIIYQPHCMNNMGMTDSNTIWGVPSEWCHCLSHHHFYIHHHHLNCHCHPNTKSLSNIVNRMITSRNNRHACMPWNDKGKKVHVDYRMHVVLIFAGLGVAMSLGLVKHIPLFDTIFAQWSHLKPELKDMTPGSTIVTIVIWWGNVVWLGENCLQYQSQAGA